MRDATSPTTTEDDSDRFCAESPGQTREIIDHGMWLGPCVPRSPPVLLNATLYSILEVLECNDDIGILYLSGFHDRNCKTLSFMFKSLIQE
jgi:hypothetical protein